MSIEFKYTPSAQQEAGGLEFVTIGYDDEIWDREGFIDVINTFIKYTGNDLRVSATCEYNTLEIKNKLVKEITKILQATNTDGTLYEDLAKKIVCKTYEVLNDNIGDDR